MELVEWGLGTATFYSEKDRLAINVNYGGEFLLYFEDPYTGKTIKFSWTENDIKMFPDMGLIYDPKTRVVDLRQLYNWPHNTLERFLQYELETRKARYERYKKIALEKLKERERLPADPKSLIPLPRTNLYFDPKTREMWMPIDPAISSDPMIQVIFAKPDSPTVTWRYCGIVHGGYLFPLKNTKSGVAFLKKYFPDYLEHLIRSGVSVWKEE